jgi:hypothetical protein
MGKSLLQKPKPWRVTKIREGAQVGKVALPFRAGATGAVPTGRIGRDEAEAQETWG